MDEEQEIRELLEPVPEAKRLTLQAEREHIEQALNQAVWDAWGKLVREHAEQQRGRPALDTGPVVTEHGEPASWDADGRLWTARVERVHPTKEIGWTFVARSWRVHLGLSIEIEPSEESQLWHRLGDG